MRPFLANTQNLRKNSLLPRRGKEVLCLLQMLACKKGLRGDFAKRFSLVFNGFVVDLWAIQIFYSDFIVMGFFNSFFGGNFMTFQFLCGQLQAYHLRIARFLCVFLCTN